MTDLITPPCGSNIATKSDQGQRWPCRAPRLKNVLCERAQSFNPDRLSTGWRLTNPAPLRPTLWGLPPPARDSPCGAAATAPSDCARLSPMGLSHQTCWAEELVVQSLSSRATRGLGAPAPNPGGLWREVGARRGLRGWQTPCYQGPEGRHPPKEESDV